MIFLSLKQRAEAQKHILQYFTQVQEVAFIGDADLDLSVLTELPGSLQTAIFNTYLENVRNKLCALQAERVKKNFQELNFQLGFTESRELVKHLMQPSLEPAEKEATEALARRVHFMTFRPSINLFRNFGVSNGTFDNVLEVLPKFPNLQIIGLAPDHEVLVMKKLINETDKTRKNTLERVAKMIMWVDTAHLLEVARGISEHDFTRALPYLSNLKGRDSL